MGVSIKTVAVASESVALGSVLSSVLLRDPALRVRRFEGPESLLAYAEIAPVHVLVCDLDGKADWFSLVGNLDPASPIRIVGLLRGIGPDTRSRCRAAGIHETLVKPLSPVLVHERVHAQLRLSIGPAVAQPNGGSLRRAVRTGWAADNVVPLFRPHVHEQRP